MAHTPGPWKADPVSWGRRHRISGNHTAVAEALSYDDALLIAEAPAMLALLKDLVRSAKEPDFHDTVAFEERARDIIAKVGSNHA